MADMNPPPTRNAPRTAPRTSTPQPQFLDFNGRRLFALHITPAGPCSGAVLYLPPFAEEMNRCRAQVASQARAFAAAGLRCLLLDPHGTGESDGEVADGDWQHWLDDAAAAAHWLIQQTGQPLTLWGVRTGALLAAELACRADLDVHRLLFWQPVIDGKLFLNQYLRLRIASQMVRDTERETTETIRKRLSAGEALEVAGYALSGRLADGLAARRMGDFASLARHRVDWIEMVSGPEQTLSIPSRRLIEPLCAQGARIVGSTVVSPLIWQLHHREDAPALQSMTLALMGDRR